MPTVQIDDPNHPLHGKTVEFPDDTPPEEIQKALTPPPPTGVIPAVKGLALETAAGFTGGVSSLAQKTSDLGTYIGNKAGQAVYGGEALPPRPNILTPAIESLSETTENLEGKANAQGAGAVSRFLGQNIGGAIPGIAEFALGPVWAGASGAAEASKEGKSEIWGAVKGAGMRYALGKVFEGVKLGGRAFDTASRDLVKKYGVNSIAEAAIKATPEEINNLLKLGKNIREIRGISSLPIGPRVPAMSMIGGVQKIADAALDGRVASMDEIASGMGSMALLGLLPGKKQGKIEKPNGYKKLKTGEWGENVPEEKLSALEGAKVPVPVKEPDKVVNSDGFEEIQFDPKAISDTPVSPDIAKNVALAESDILGVQQLDNGNIVWFNDFVTGKNLYVSEKQAEKGPQAIESLLRKTREAELERVDALEKVSQKTGVSSLVDSDAKETAEHIRTMYAEKDAQVKQEKEVQKEQAILPHPPLMDYVEGKMPRPLSSIKDSIEAQTKIVATLTAKVGSARGSTRQRDLSRMLEKAKVRLSGLQGEHDRSLNVVFDQDHREFFQGASEATRNIISGPVVIPTEEGGKQANRSESNRDMVAPFLPESNLSHDEAADVLKNASEGKYPRKGASDQWYVLKKSAEWYDENVRGDRAPVMPEGEKVEESVPFSKSGEKTSGIPKQKALLEMKRLEIQFKNLDKFLVINSERELPKHIRDRSQSLGYNGTVEGVYDPKTKMTYILSDNISSKERVQEVVKHELTHAGIRNILGEKISPVFEDVAKSFPKELEAIASEYNLDLKKTSDRFTAVDELIARHGQEYKDQPVIKRFISAVREWLRKAGFKIEWSDDDILNLAGAALKKAGQGEDMRFSLKEALSPELMVDKTPVYRNPKELPKSQSGSYKGILSKDGKLYVWTDAETTHGDVAKRLELPPYRRIDFHSDGELIVRGAKGPLTSQSELARLTKALKGNEDFKRLFGDGSSDPSFSLKSKMEDTKTEAKDFIGKSKEVLSELWDKYSKVPEYTHYKGALLSYLGDRQKTSIELNKKAKDVIARFPKPSQEAMTNFLEAGGDMNVLKQRAAATKDPELRSGYENAMKLTPEEKAFASEIRAHFDENLDRAIAEGIIDQGVENYVHHIFGKDHKLSKDISAMVNSGLLKTDPDLAKKRLWSSFFEGEQMGKRAKDKRIGFLMTAYDQSLNEAISARAFVKSLLEIKAKDGRPVAAISGSGFGITESEVANQRLNRPLTEKKDSKDLELDGEPDPNKRVATLIKPNAKPEEMSDYLPIDHPALRGWKMVKNVNGKDVYLEGNILIHPDVWKGNHSDTPSLNNILKPTPVNKAKSVALKLSQEFKGTLLSASGFHQAQEGLHALFHGVNPFKHIFDKGQINLNEPIQKDLVYHGLMIYDHSALQQFAEGSSSPGLTNKIPLVGEYLQKYSEYLFQGFIPRLKMAMAKEAFERNLKRYEKTLNRDQILEMTATQANAAFGELNYRALGRSKQFMDTVRLAALAPDFLEARVKFVAQAFKPYGKGVHLNEQATALIRGALGMYGTAAVLNLLFSDDHEAHLDRPFTVVAKGKEYSLRSVPGDLIHLFRDPRSFVYHRMNPFTARTLVEGLSGRDQYGQERETGDQAWDWIKSGVPIPAQGFLSGSHKDLTIVDSALQAIGITGWKHKTDAEKMTLDLMLKRVKTTPSDEAKERLKVELGLQHEYRKTQNKTPVMQAVKEGKIGTVQAQKIFKHGKEALIESEFKHLDVYDAFNVFKVANPDEKKRLKPLLAKKVMNFKAASPAEIKEVRERLRKIQAS